MDHYEMVETLRNRANVTYEEAKAALEASGWDILDALVLLENDGKVEKTVPEFTTKEPEAPRRAARRVEVRESLARLGAWIRKMFTLGNQNHFVISRKGDELAAMPITVMVLLTVLVWPFSLIILFTGLILGTRYSFRGPDICTAVNDFAGSAQDKAAAAVEARVE